MTRAGFFTALYERAVADDPDLMQWLAEVDRVSVAVEFFQRLRPGGPWGLTAIVPDGNTTTITARTPDDVDAFVRKHDGKRNLYYATNPLRREMSKKASKTDVAAIEFLLG